MCTCILHSGMYLCRLGRSYQHWTWSLPSSSYALFNVLSLYFFFFFFFFLSILSFFLFPTSTQSQIIITNINYFYCPLLWHPPLILILLYFQRHISSLRPPSFLHHIVLWDPPGTLQERTFRPIYCFDFFPSWHRGSFRHTRCHAVDTVSWVGPRCSSPWTSSYFLDISYPHLQTLVLLHSFVSFCSSCSSCN